MLPFMKERSKRLAKEEAAPRIINITSVAGLLPVPFMAPYCGSKHAAEAFSGALRMELMSWGVKVVTANPSFHRTPLVLGGASTVVRCWNGVDKATQAEYGEEYAEAVVAKATTMMSSMSWESSNVTRSLQDAVSLYRPRSQLLVGSDARTVMPLLRQLPSWVAEGLNWRHSFGHLPVLAALGRTNR